MNRIKVGFSAPRKWWKPFSLIIRLVDWTSYSHVYVSFYSNKYERRLVYQASSLFVNFFGPTMFAEEAIVIREFDLEISDEAYKRFMQFAVDNAGCPYDLLSVFGIAVVKVAALFGKKIPNPFGNRKGVFFCSELVGAILTEVLGKNLDMNIDAMTPKDIYKYMVAHEQSAAQNKE